MVAQALGGKVLQRTAARRHYALQESELLFDIGNATFTSAVQTAVSRARRDKEGGSGGRVDGQDVPPLRMLYHHNDEVCRLPLMRFLSCRFVIGKTCTKMMFSSVSVSWSGADTWSWAYGDLRWQANWQPTPKPSGWNFPLL